MMLRGIFNKLINVGTHDGIDHKLANRIKVNNRLAITYTCLAILYFFIFINFQPPIVTYSTLVIGAIQLIILPLNHLRLYNISRIYLSISNVFICFFYSGLIGPNSGILTFYIAAFFAPLVRFNFSEKWQLAVCYTFVLSMIILEVYFDLHSFKSPIFTTEEQHGIFPYLFPLTFIMIILYGRAILKEQIALESKATNLEIKTEKQTKDLVDNYKKLRENERDLQVIVSSLNDGLMLFDRSFKISKYWGKNIKKELSSLHDYFSKDNIQIISEKIEGNYNYPISQDLIELKLQDSKYLNCSLHQVDQNRFVISIKDITDKKLIQEESDKRKKLLEDIIANLPTDIVLLDYKHRYLVANEVAIKDPVVRKWIIGKDDFDYCREYNKPIQIAVNRRKQFESVVNSKKAIEWEEELQEKENSKFILRRMSPIINDDKVEFVIGFAIDITKIKQAEKKLVNAKNIAEENAKHKSQFLSTMSHEIRTPLNAIIGISHLLKDQNSATQTREYTKSMHFAAKNLLNLINDILDYNKIESGNISLEKRPINLHNFLEQLTKQHEQHARDKGNTIRLEVSVNIPINVLGDEVRLSQVLNNLLSNANKFTKNGIINLKVDVKESGNVSFEVIDTGIGIKKENQQKIFESFIQEYASTTRKYGGTGLGLAISKKLITLMGGELKLTSEYKSGTNFHFDIPLDFIEKKTSITVTQKESVFADNKAVLIVEDNELNAMITEKFLNKWNIYNIDFAKNGKVATKLNKLKNYDLILMDLQMPIMDGYTAAEEIRKKDLKTIIIALTAEALPDIKDKIISSGMNAYISKPFDPKDLYNTLSNYLN